MEGLGPYCLGLLFCWVFGVLIDDTRNFAVRAEMQRINVIMTKNYIFLKRETVYQSQIRILGALLAREAYSSQIILFQISPELVVGI